MSREFPIGTRVRLLPPSRTGSGWRGCATLLETMCRGDGTSGSCYGGYAIKDGSSKVSRYHDVWFAGPENGEVEAAPFEWAVMRDQTPNPEHVDAVRAARE